MAINKTITEPKILLVNPSTFKEAYGKYKKGGGNAWCLGICYIAAVLEKNRFNVQLLDADTLNLTLEQTLGKIKEINPDIVGITCMTAIFSKAKDLAIALKKMDPNLFIIIGGAHVSAQPKFTMDFDCFDIGVIGEGEYTVLELIQKISKGKDYSNIKGIVYKKDGIYYQTPMREIITNLDELPFPAYHLLPDIKYYHPQITSYKKKPVATMITSRGCPFQCVFCDSGVFGKKVRFRSPENVVVEIEHLVKKYHVKEIRLYDDLFTFDKKRAEKICDLLIEKKLGFIWSCLIRADCVSKELLAKMKSAGCWLIGLGIETGDEKVMKFIKKGISLKQMEDCVRWAKEAGIKTRGFFMIGHPIDTVETVEKTIAFAKKLPLFIAEFSIVTPYPNTELYELAPKYGEIISRNLSKYSEQFTVYVPKGLTKEYIEKAHKRAREEFYLRPKKILEFLLEIRTIGDIKRYITAFRMLTGI